MKRRPGRAAHFPADMNSRTLWKIALLVVATLVAMVVVSQDPELKNDAHQFLRQLLRQLF